MRGRGLGGGAEPWAQALVTQFGCVAPISSVALLQRACCDAGTSIPFTVVPLRHMDRWCSVWCTERVVWALADQLRQLLLQHGGGWTMHNGQYSREWMGQWIFNDLQQVFTLGTWTLDRYAVPPLRRLVSEALSGAAG